MADNLELKVIFTAVDKFLRPVNAITTGARAASKELKNARDALKALGDQQKLIDGFRSTNTALGIDKRKLEEARTAVKKLAGEIAATNAPSVALQRAFAEAKKEAAGLSANVNRLAENKQRLRTQLGAVGIDTRQLSTAQRDLKGRIDLATAAVNAQSKALETANRRMQRMKAAQADLAKAQERTSKLRSAGAGMMIGGGASLWAGARFIQPGLEFDEEMSSVQALARLEKTSAAMKALRQQARELGANTSFTATEVGQGQGFLAMAGFDPKSILAAMPAMLDVSKAGRIDLAQTSDIASNILTGFKLQADQMARVGDVLVGTFTRSNTNLTMLGDTMKYVAPIAAGLGQDIETTAAMTGKLGDAGIQASMAGTALRAIMSRLAAPPKAAAKAIEELELKTEDAYGNLRPMPDLLAEIHQKTKAMGDAQRAGIFKNIAGEEAFSGLAVLVQQAGSGELQKLIATLKAAQGEAAKNATSMADNARGDLKNLQSAWEDLGITVMETNDGPLRGAIQSITGVVRGIGEWSRENPVLAGGIVKAAAGLAILVAGGGALLIGISAVLGPLALARFAFTALGISGVTASGMIAGGVNIVAKAVGLFGNALLWIGRIALAHPILALITAIAAGALYVWQNWDTLGPKFRALIDTIGNYFGNLKDRAIEAGRNMIDGMISGISSRWDALKTTVTGIGDKSVNWVKDKLDIHSPSRVFAELGGYVMQGFAQGMSNGENGPLSAIDSLSRRLAAIGAGVIIGGTAAASPIAAEARPSLTATSATAAPMQVTIHIHGAAGQGVDDIRRQVEQALENLDRRQQAQARRRLRDMD